MAYGFEKVKNEAIRYADEAKRKLSAKKVYLYGSYAKGTAGKGSDVDICFFFDNIDGGQSQIEIISKLIMLGTKYDAFFEPNAMPTSELYNDNPFVKEIVQTGVELI
ncbi:MAG: nucleotidyltransferase domain-containing protein [Chitinispirillales bacterium]|jgi:predicted nucleotidyltransferase|nr:nucleotidyltransferase domain-containing protein [Chitinispirillales bacterium]